MDRKIGKARAEIKIEPVVKEYIDLEKEAGRDIFSIAKATGFLAAKKWIPLLGPSEIDNIDIEIRYSENDGLIIISCEVETDGEFNLQAEAISAVAATCIIIYDSCKDKDKNMVIQSMRQLS